MVLSDEQKLERIQLSSDWKQVLREALLSERMDGLREFLKQQLTQGQVIYPPTSDWFKAFDLTAPRDVKVVILGQDPYHGPGQAQGLSFSVARGMPIPPSLRNILHELSTDLKVDKPVHGDLTSWANQGVLLLNAVLTVSAGQAASHQNQGWEEFTDAVIEYLNHSATNLVFILWGSYAQKKGRYIDPSKHLILTAVHPSPLAANRGGFFGQRPFSKTNQYLRQHGKSPIDWSLS